MRLVLPTARSPTTLIFSLRRRSRKDSATPLPGSKALRDDYQRVNSAKRRLGRDRTGGNPSSALRGIGLWDHGLRRRREDHLGPGKLQSARLGRPRRHSQATRRAAGDGHGPQQPPEPEQADPPRAPGEAPVRRPREARRRGTQVDLLRALGQGPQDPASRARRDHASPRPHRRPRRDRCVPRALGRVGRLHRRTRLQRLGAGHGAQHAGRSGPRRSPRLRLLNRFRSRRPRLAVYRPATARAVLRAARRGVSLLTPTGVRETVMSARRLRTGVIRTWRGKAEWAVPLLLFLAIVLVAALAFNVANLDTGGEAIPGGGAQGGTQPSAFGVFDPLLGDLLLIVFASFVVAILVHAFLRRRVRQRAPTKPFSWWQVISSAIGLILIIALLLA